MLAAAVAGAVALFTSAGAAGAGESTGVTPNSITVGIVTPDLEQVASLGFVEDFGALGPVYEALFDEINEKGGIHGRTVDVALHEWDPLKLQASIAAQCLAVTQDDEAFVVVATAFTDPGPTCVADQNQTPLVVADSIPQHVIEETGKVFDLSFSGEAALRATAELMAKQKHLKGKTIGVIIEDIGQANIAAKKALIPELKKRGLGVAETATLPGIGEDPSLVTGAVQRFQSAGIDTVFVVSNPFNAGQFMTDADVAGYHPTYIVSDFGTAANNTIHNFAPPAALENTFGVTWRATGMPRSYKRPADDVACNKRITKATGVKAPVGSQRFGVVAEACTAVALVARALERAGADPTRAAFVEAMQGLGTFRLGNGGDASFSPTKGVAPDQAHIVKWDTDCECFRDTSGFLNLQ